MMFSSKYLYKIENIAIWVYGSLFFFFPLCYTNTFLALLKFVNHKEN
jgi:hypothetical protein